MKKIILLNICALSLLINFHVYAQELPEITENLSLNNFEIESQIESTSTESIQVEATSTPSILNDFSVMDEDTIDVEIQDVATTTSSINLLVRNNVTILSQKEIQFEDDKTIDILDNSGKIHVVPSNSVLGLLYEEDMLNDTFQISDIQYYESFNALYLKCITVGTEKLCDNWQYVINAVGPWTSIDTSLVKSGDSVGLYFGSPYQIIFDTHTYTSNVPVIAYTQAYDYQTNVWNPRIGVTVGITTPNPIDPWNPIVLSTYPVDIKGEATFIIATSGVYTIGVAEDFYYPSYSITVATDTSTTTATTTDSGGGGSGGNVTLFNVNKAISFLKSLQASNGSYGGSQLYTDWVAIAFGAVGENDSSLENYLKSTSGIKNLLTDNERRAMALLALGKNPYDFEKTNYIDAIIKEFDGTQFGEKQLVNDDIFALIVLSKTGFTSDEDMIKKTVSFIISKQSSNGSWENSLDLTASAIQALIQFDSVPGSSSSIAAAKNYLKNSQQSDGGWNSVYSTSWVMQAMNGLGEKWNKNGKDGENYLKGKQESDGGVLPVDESVQNRIWATGYAIPAVLGKSWNDILISVSKPVIDIKNTGDSNNTNQISTSTATSTNVIVETKIPEVATTSILSSASSSVPQIREPYINNQQVDLKDDSINSESKPIPQIKEEQLVLVSQTSFLKSWWLVYIGGFFVLIGFIFGVKYLKF